MKPCWIVLKMSMKSSSVVVILSVVSWAKYLTGSLVMLLQLHRLLDYLLFVRLLALWNTELLAPILGSFGNFYNILHTAKLPIWENKHIFSTWIIFSVFIHATF